MAAPGLKRGYSLLETLVVLGIMAVVASIIVPKATGALDQVVAHTVFFDFQRQVLDLRRQAFKSVDPIFLVSTISDATVNKSELEAVDANHATPLTITLRAGWTYQLSAPIRIGAGGDCSRSDVDLYNAGHKIVRLQGESDACRFIRVVS